MAAARPYRIVCIGGGTGLPVVLRGLREYRQRRCPGWERIDLSSVTAIVSFSDDGGSSGRLIREYDTLPPGDLRNCLLALADPALVPLMTQFFNHRFSTAEGETLGGHSAGNLLIVALAQLHEGDVRKAILDVSRLLGIEGKIMFPTLEPAVLCAELSDGSVVVGESNIAFRSNPHPIARVFLAARGDERPRPERKTSLPSMPEALEAIAEADTIILGPGSLYSSVIANLLVPDVAAAVAASRATKIYVANLMVEPGETDSMSVARHLEAIRGHGGIEIDYVIANKTPIDPAYARLYTAERLQRELEIVQRWLQDEVVSENGIGHRGDAVFAQRVARMQLLLNGLSCPEADRGQVILRQPRESLGEACVIEIDALREEQIPDGAALKRVLRHDPERLIGGILETLEAARQRARMPRSGRGATQAKTRAGRAKGTSRG